jgi:hypothetical protein
MPTKRQQHVHKKILRGKLILAAKSQLQEFKQQEGALFTGSISRAESLPYVPLSCSEAQTYKSVD